MTTLRNFALCVFCALAFGCGGGEPDTVEAPEPETTTGPPAPPAASSEAARVRANLMRSCDGEDSDFCAAAYAAIASWVAGELTDEEFVQEIVSLRAEPEPEPELEPEPEPFRILSMVANCSKLTVKFSELISLNLWGTHKRERNPYLFGGLFLAVDRDRTQGREAFIEDESHYIRFTSWEEDFFRVREGMDSSILIFELSEPVLAGQEVELDMAVFVLPWDTRNNPNGEDYATLSSARGPFFPPLRKLADAEGASPQDGTLSYGFPSCHSRPNFPPPPECAGAFERGETPELRFLPSTRRYWYPTPDTLQARGESLAGGWLRRRGGVMFRYRVKLIFTKKSGHWPVGVVNRGRNSVS